MNVRIIEPMLIPRIVRTEKTMAALVFGVGSSTEWYLYHFGVTSATCQVFLWSLWYVGVTIGLLVLGGLLPAPWVLGCLLALPMPLVAFLLFSKDLVLEVLHELEFYIVLLLQGVLVAHALLGLTHTEHDAKWDPKGLAVVSYIPSMIVMGLIDAYPAKYRARFEVLFASGAIAVLVAWNTLIILHHGNWVHLGTQLGDNVTLLLFYLRHVYVAVAHPSAFVVIASMVQTKKQNVMAEFSTGDLPVFMRTDSTVQHAVEAPRSARKSYQASLSLAKTSEEPKISPRGYSRGMTA